MNRLGLAADDRGGQYSDSLAEFRDRVGLGIHAPIPCQNLFESPPIDSFRDRTSDESTERGKEIDLLDDLVDSTAGLQPRLRFRQLDDQGNPNHFIIGSLAVGPETVVIEFFAMVRSDDDQRLVVALVRFQLGDERRDFLLIEVVQLGVIKGACLEQVLFGVLLDLLLVLEVRPVNG